MPISPTVEPNSGTLAGLVSKDADFDRRLRTLENARTLGVNGVTSAHIGPGQVDYLNLAVDSVRAANIKAGEINASHIDATSISTAVLTADSINATMIQTDAIKSRHIDAQQILTEHLGVGSVDATSIAAGSITTTKLSISAQSSSLIINGSAEGGVTDGWFLEESTGPTGTLTSVVDSAAPQGDRVFAIGPGNTAYGHRGIAVTPGEKYTVRLWLKHSNGNGAYYVRIQQNATLPAVGYFGHVSTGAPTVPERTSYTDLTTAGANSTITSWTQKEYTWTCPAGIYWASPAVYNWTTSTGTLYFDAVEFRQQIPGVEIENGTITATQVNASSVRAAIISAGLITATDIDAASVRAGIISAGLITATDINAASIRTAILTANSITTGMIAANTVTATEVNAASVRSAIIAAGLITATDINATSVRTAILTANSITTGMIAAGTVTATEINAASIRTAILTTDSVVAATIAANQVTSKHIATDTATADRIIASVVNSTTVAANGLAAISANMGTMTAGIINGGSLRVGSATGPTIKLGSGISTTGGTKEGIVMADASGNILMHADSATGNLLLKGQIQSGSTGLGNFTDTLGAGQVGFATGGTNFLANSSFDNPNDALTLQTSPTHQTALTNVKNWLAYTSAVAGTEFQLNTGTIRTPGRSIRVKRTAGTGHVGVQQSVSASIARGRPHTLSAWFYNTTVAALNASVTFDWNEGATYTPVAKTASCPPGVWTRITITGTPSATSTGGSIYAWLTSGVTGNELLIDDIQFQEGDVPTQWAPKPDEILPGTIRGGLDGLNSMLVAGTIVGSDMVADTVTTRELNVTGGGGNLWRDTSYEETDSTQQVPMGQFLGVTTNAVTPVGFSAVHGTKVARFTANTTGAGAGAFYHDNASKAAEVVPGMTYVVSIYARGDSTGSADKRVKLQIREYNAAGTNIADVTLTTDSTNTALQTLTSTGWTRLYGRYTASASAAKAGLLCWTDRAVGGQVSGDIYYFDAAMLQEGQQRSGYTPFSTTGGITANQILANAVTATSIKSDAIDGMTITGSTVQTAASGARVVLGSGVINVYDAVRQRAQLAPTGLTLWKSDGTPVFTQDASGNITMSGTLSFTNSISASQVTGALTAATLPATGLTSGAVPAGVTLPATQLSSGTVPAGVTVPATQLGTGTVPAGVTVPAAQLGTGTVASGVTLPAAQVGSGSLNAATVVNTANLANNAVTAAKTLFTIGGGNLLGNSSFEDPTYNLGWAAANGTPAQETTIVHNGGKSYKLTSTTTGNFYATPTRVSINAGETYTASAWVYSTVALTANMYLRFWNSTPAIVNQTNPSFAIAANTWTRITNTLTAGAATVTADAIPLFVATAGGQVVYFDDVQLETGDIATAWSPKADEILAGAVGDTQISSGVTASKISGSLTAATIPANQLSTGTVPAGVTVPATQLGTGTVPAGVTVPATQLGTGTVPAGVTVPAAQLGTGTVPATVTVPATQLGAGAVPSGVTVAPARLSTGAVPAGVTLPATQLSTGAVPAGVTLPATQLTSGAVPAGVTVPAPQVTSGALPAGVTIPATQLSSGALPAGVTLPFSQATGLIQNSYMDVNSVTSPKIAANNVTARELNVTGAVGNLWNDSSWEETVTTQQPGVLTLNTTGATGRITTGPTPMPHGTTCYQLIALASGEVAAYTEGTGTALNRSAEVRQGQTYVISMYVRSAATPRVATLQARELTALGAFSAVKNLTDPAGNTPWTATTTTTGWTRLWGLYTPSAGIGRVGFRIGFAGAAANEVHYIDAHQLAEGDVLTAYTPYSTTGGITANQILAGSIQASHIGVTTLGALVANLGTVTSGTITASSISGGTITGTTITGGTIQTAASGSNRIELTSANGLRKINSDNTTIPVQLGATNGLDLLSGVNGSPPNDRKLRWLDASSRTITELTSYSVQDNVNNSSNTYLRNWFPTSLTKTNSSSILGFASRAGVNQSADLNFQVNPDPVGNGTSYIFMSALPETGAGAIRMLLDNTGRSDFVQADAAYGTGKIKVGYGTFGGTTANAVQWSLTFNHSLGFTPSVVVIASTNGTNLAATSVGTLTSTQFTVVGRWADNVARAATFGGTFMAIGTF